MATKSGERKVMACCSTACEGALKVPEPVAAGDGALGDVPETPTKLSKSQKKSRTVAKLRTQVEEFEERVQDLEVENQILREQDSADLRFISAKCETLKRLLEQERKARASAEKLLKAKTDELKVLKEVIQKDLVSMRTEREAEIESLEMIMREGKVENIPNLRAEYERHVQKSKEQRESLEMNLAAKQDEISTLMVRLEEALKVSSSSQDVKEETQVASGGTPRHVAKKRKLEEPMKSDDEDEYEDEVDTLGYYYGDVDIIQDNPEGKFVMLKNHADKEISLRGWTLLRTAGEKNTEVEFQPEVKLGPKATLTVWSGDAEDEAKLMVCKTNLVLKDSKWHTSDRIVTTLWNFHGEEVAQRVTQREKIDKESEEAEDEVYYEASDGGEAKGDRCALT